MRAYNGVDEIRQIMNDILDAKQHISAMLPWDEMARPSWRTLYGRFHRKPLPAIFPHPHPHAKIKGGCRSKRTMAKSCAPRSFFPPRIEINDCSFIYANKVAIISLNKKRPLGILIEDEDIHHTMEVLFESLWHQSGGV